jgi:hypothetical protein
MTRVTACVFEVATGLIGSRNFGTSMGYIIKGWSSGLLLIKSVFIPSRISFTFLT